jgi:Skp family chaperone for outer membrane proteins
MISLSHSPHSHVATAADQKQRELEQLQAELKAQKAALDNASADDRQRREQELAAHKASLEAKEKASAEERTGGRNRRTETGKLKQHNSLNSA